MSKLYRSELTIGGEKLNVIAVNYENEETKVAETKVVESIHHIHVIDRSGSMYSDIDNLIDNVIETFNHINENDLISVIWFSSEDQCKILFKGATIHSKEMIIKKLDSIRSVTGCTCFSEPLKSIKDIMLDLSDICPNFNITFFTDGCTVTPWSDDEERFKIFSVLKPLKEKILAFNTVGYGNWYDEELLKDMSACSMFGRFTHSKEIKDYSTIFKHEYENIKDIIPETVEVSSELSEILYLTNRNTKFNMDTMKLSFLNKTKNQFFIVTNNPILRINDNEYKVADITRKIAKPTMLNFLYAYAKELYYNGRQHQAIDILVHTGDKFVIDSVMNAFTRDERANVVELLNKTFINNKTRLQHGEVGLDYIPSPDAYNVIDFLTELTTVQAEYIPVENYNRIGKKVVDEFNLFRKNEEIEVKSNMDELVFNDKKLNVSIRYLIHGFVDLNPRQAKKVGLESTYPTKMYRMQTIIKDGTLNVPIIKVRITMDNVFLLSEKARNFLSTNHYSISIKNGVDNSYYTIDLSKLPVTNRKYSEMSIEEILENTKELIKWKSRKKVVKCLAINNFTPSSDVILDLTDEQIDVLKEHGLNNKFEYVGVANKAIENEDKDFYEARSIEFGIKGCSAIPKISDSLNKKINNKKLNIMDEEINRTSEEFTSKSQKEIKVELITCNQAINKISSMLFSAKVSKVLTGGWWSGLEVTAKNEQFTKDDTTLIVKTKREKVYL